MRINILYKATVIILFTFIVSNVAAQDDSNFYKKIWSLSVQIATGYKPLAKERVAVVGFTTLDGEPCRLGELIAEKLTTYLKRCDHFTLVERTYLKKVMEENRISHSMLFDRSTANRLGELVGAKAIIIGSVTDMGNVVDTNARMIHCEKGTVLSTASTVMNTSEEIKKLLMGCKKTVKPPENALSSKYEEYKLIIEKLKILEHPIEQPESTFKVDIWTDRLRYRVGDEISFRFRANRDCYLTIIDIGPSGNITVLFPNKFKQNNFIRANRTYTIPSEGYDMYTFKVEPPSGIDRIKAIASLEPLSIEHYQFKKYAFRSIDPTDTRGTRDIGVYVNRLSESSEGTWAKDSLSVLIE